MKDHLIATIIIAVFVLALVVWLLEPAMGDYRKGYYNYNDQCYYSQGSSWYRYDDTSGWDDDDWSWSDDDYSSDDWDDSDWDWDRGSDWDSDW